MVVPADLGELCTSLAAAAEDFSEGPLSGALPLPPPEEPPPCANLCAGGCLAEVKEHNASALPKWCKSCFDRELQIRIGSTPASDDKFTTPEKSQCADAVSNPVGSSKWSPCTWWQKLKSEEGIGKAEALRQWKNMSSKERETFKQSIADRMGSPAAATSLQQKKVPSSNGPVLSLERFEEKWSSTAKGLAKCQDAASYMIQHYEEAFLMYVDAASLLRAKVFKDALSAQKRLHKFHLNRKKLSAVQKWLDANPDHPLTECPPEFLPGRHCRGALTMSQKRDLLKHVQIMQASNCTFGALDARKCMFRYFLINIGVADADTTLDWSEFEEYRKGNSMQQVYRGWMEWVNNVHPEVQLANKKVIVITIYLVVHTMF